jgi:hypothetical protein
MVRWVQCLICVSFTWPLKKPGYFPCALLENRDKVYFNFESALEILCLEYQLGACGSNFVRLDLVGKSYFAKVL